MTQPNAVNKATGKFALITAYIGVAAEALHVAYSWHQMLNQKLSADECERRQEKLWQHFADLKDLEPMWEGWTIRRKRQPKQEFKPVQRWHFPEMPKAIKKRAQKVGAFFTPDWELPDPSYYYYYNWPDSSK